MADSSTPRVENVRGSGIYPATGPFPPGPAPVRSPAALAHPEERVARRGPRFETAALVAGRLILGGYFLYNGVNHFLNRKMMADYTRAKGVPAADLAVPASGLLILAGGLSILTGVAPKTGAALIATFLLGVSPTMHAFWDEEDARQRMNEMVNFTKNVALVGTTLLVAAHPEPWPWRLDVGSSRDALVPAHA
jgi:putative oxidoreductase